MNDSINTWFNGWERLASVAVGAVFFYALIVLVVRVAGKRLTSQMNNFDWIVTIAIGSLAGSGILLKEVSIADSTVAIVILVALQWLTTRLVRQSDVVRGIIKPAPTLLTHKGQFIEENMSRERVSKAEVRACLREHGYTSLSEANWVILETDGSLTVIPRCDVALDEAELLSDVSAPGKLQDSHQAATA